MALKPKQMKLAELMVAEPNTKNIEYAEKIGISEKTFYTYKADPEFQEYLTQLCQERFKDMERLAMKELRKAVSNGNFKAISYVLDGLGYKAEDKIHMDGSMEAKIEIDYGEG